MDFMIEDEQSHGVMQERDIVPVGVHEMVIKHAEEGPNEYKACDVNPDGTCLKLRLATVLGNHKFVFDDIPKHMGWRAKQLADAIGVKPAGGKLSLQPDAVVGVHLAVEVSHYTSKAGKVSAVVKRYVPTATPQAPAKAEKQRPQKAVAAVADDIPF